MVKLITLTDYIMNDRDVFFTVGVCHPDLLLFGYRPPEDVCPGRARVSPQMFPVLHRRLPQALHASHGQTLRQPSRSMHQVSLSFNLI